MFLFFFYNFVHYEVWFTVYGTLSFMFIIFSVDLSIIWLVGTGATGWLSVPMPGVCQSMVGGVSSSMK